jgi:hypothetical protein
MTEFSDELLRTALAEGAATVRPEELKPLPEPVRRRRRWTMPHAGLTVAAAAVVAVVAVVLVAPWSRHGPGAPAPRFALAASAGDDFVLDGPWPPGSPTVTVHEADSGRAIATVPAPPGSSGFVESADSGDNRTFVLTTAAPHACEIRFYRLTLEPDGRPKGPLTELRRATLRQRTGEEPEQLAVSPGARRIAYAGTECGSESPRGVITVVDPATGDRRVTRLPSRAFANSPRWAPDGRELVFEMVGDYRDRTVNTLDVATGEISTIRLAEGGAMLAGAAFDRSGTHIVALVRDGGHNRLVWYSPAAKKVTRQVELPPSSADAPSDFTVSGDRVVAMIDDQVHVVTGTKVTTEGLPRP